MNEPGCIFCDPDAEPKGGDCEEGDHVAHIRLLVGCAGESVAFAACGCHLTQEEDGDVALFMCETHEKAIEEPKPGALTDAQREEYVEKTRKDGTHCPRCGGTDWYAETLDAEGPQAWQKFRCSKPDCNGRWSEVFQLSTVETPADWGDEED